MKVIEIACLVLGILAVVIASMSLVKSRKLGAQFDKLDSMIDDEIAKDENGLTAKMQVYYHKTIEPLIEGTVKGILNSPFEKTPYGVGGPGGGLAGMAKDVQANSQIRSEVEGIVGKVGLIEKALLKSKDEIKKVLQNPTIQGDLTVVGDVTARNVTASTNVTGVTNVIAQGGMLAKGQLIVSKKATMLDNLDVGGTATVGALKNKNPNL